ncbi:hypothetical protein BDW71DRAFT_178754 [Aspergillus fruticulosus]
MDPSQSLPPTSVLLSIIGDFFQNIHGPYFGCVQPSSVRRNLDADTLPRYFALAVFALAVPSSPEPFRERIEDALKVSVQAAQESWELVLTSHGPEGADNPTFELAQTLSTLSEADYQASRLRSAFEKTDAAVKVSRALRLTIEPYSSLAFTEQEERRRVFWHIYMQDKLYSCAKSRPHPVLRDEECGLQLPTHEEVYRAGEWQSMLNLEDMLDWDFQTDGDLPPYCIVVFLAAILGRCTRYIYRDDDGMHDQPQNLPPWSADSEFVKMTSQLAGVGSHFQPSILLPSVETFHNGVGIRRETARSIIYSTLLFHQCHCLVNHPILARERSKPFGPRNVSASFTLHVLHANAAPHARQLVDLVDKTHGRGDLNPLSACYPFWTVIAGGILSIASHFEARKGHALNQTNAEAAESQQYVFRAVKLLEGLAQDFPAAANMAVRLREFHAHHAHIFAASLNPTSSSDPDDDKLDPVTEQALWTMIDHELVGAYIPAPAPRLSDTSTCPSTDLGSEESYS